MNTSERAECGRLAHSVNALLPALEQFNRFDGPDLAGPERSEWRRVLDQSLPERSQGLNSVLNELQAVIIPDGLRIGAPGFAGWVTTNPVALSRFSDRLRIRIYLRAVATRAQANGRSACPRWRHAVMPTEPLAKCLP